MRLHLNGRTRAGILEGRVRQVLRAGNGEQIISGQVVPVMPASGPAVFRVRVIDAEWLTLSEALPDGDVKRARDLGWRTSTDARQGWLAVNDRRVRQMTVEQRDTLTDTDWDAVWDRHSDRRVWLLTIAVEPQAETPRFLARGTRADGVQLLDNSGFPRRVGDGGEIARGYTTVANGAVDDAECVSDTDLARFRLEADQREILLLENKLDQVRSILGEVRRGELERDLRVIEQRLDRMRQRFQAARSAA